MAKCEKVTYYTKLAAMIALMQIRAKDDHKHTESRVYPCGNHFHLTSREL